MRPRRSGRVHAFLERVIVKSDEEARQRLEVLAPSIYRRMLQLLESDATVLHARFGLRLLAQLFHIDSHVEKTPTKTKTHASLACIRQRIYIYS